MAAMNDEDLDKLLKEWQPHSAVPPSFNRQIWDRIENQSALAGWEDWLARLLRPKWAAGIMAASMAVGGGIGLIPEKNDPSKSQAPLSPTEQKRQEYLQSIDPTHVVDPKLR
jgi:hypothetical protein